MSNDDTGNPSNDSISSGGVQHAHPAKSRSSFFSIPAPVKRVFDKFPLVTYEENILPLRAIRSREDCVLHVFTTQEDAAKGKPSFNPSCLKWQTYLRITGVRFKIIPSNNHASPSGALPFLQPASYTTPAGPVPSNKLKKWTQSQSNSEKVPEANDLRYEAYLSLLDNRIRKAWLLQLYLTHANTDLLHRLYIAPCSSNPLIQMTIAYQLRGAAEHEIVKASTSATRISAEDIMHDAHEAFSALSKLLGEDEWFFGAEKPGLFDATVFAYTHLLLDDGLEWKDNPLREHVEEYEDLLRHRQRILEMYY